MRLLVIIVCISGFLAKDIARLSWEIRFIVNQQQIIAEKCENKAIPMLHCNGKCYLSKQLEKLELKEQQHHSKTNPYSIEKMDWIPAAISGAPAIILPEEPTSTPPNRQKLLTSQYLAFVFHPPAMQGV